jgi:SPP1 gp7 family putative phage head morphogenesis protein
MDAQHEKIAAEMARNMSHAAKAAASDAMLNDVSVDEALSTAADAIDNAIDNSSELNTLAVNGSINLGRTTVFERYPEEVYAMQYSAILDDVTCDFCMSLDGYVLSASEALGEYDPPAHYECRCILVEILQDEAMKPDIETVDEGIPAIGNLDDFQQLDAPIVGPDDPAAKLLRQEIDDRQTKIDQYKKDGQYNNRVDQHSQRINDLLNSLGDSTDEEEFFEALKTFLAADGIQFS